MSVRSIMPKMTSSAIRFCCAACVICALSPVTASAQMKKKPGSVEGSPLDTILSTRLWTTPPDAKDFVRETRPDVGKLDYTPLYGNEPNRPKPRDAANVKALQAELEHDIQMNEKRAKVLGGVSKSDAVKPGAAKPETGRLPRKPGTKGAAASAR